MKQYLWAGLAVLFVSAYASDNPFDLKENFGRLDKDQEVLLSELKKIAAEKALAEENIEEPILEKKSIEKENTKVEEVPPALEIEPLKRPVAEEKKNTFMENTGEEKEVLVPVAEKKNIEVEKNEAKENEKLLQAVKEKEAELQRAKDEARKLEDAKKEAERREVEAYEKQRAEKLARKKAAELKPKLPKELQEFKEYIDTKVEGKSKQLEGEVRNIFENLLKEKNNPNFSLDDAKKIIDGNKKAGMAIITYVMSKSLARYNQLTPNEKKEFDEKAMAAIDKDMSNNSAKKSKKEKMDEYIKKYPNEIRALGFAFLEDILSNGIPQVDFNMQMSVDNSSNDGELKTHKVESGNDKQREENVVDINITREEAEAKIMADKAYEEAVKEMSQED